MKKIIIGLSVFFLLSIFTVVGLIYASSRTPIGVLHPVFTILKLISDPDTEIAFVQALESEDPQALATYRDTVAQFYQISGDVLYKGKVEDDEYRSEGYTLPINIYSSQQLKKNEQGNSPVIIYFHGGGFSSGNIDVIEKLAKQLAIDSKAVVLTPGYRLAPEYKYPAALNDAYAALHWALGKAEENHWDTQNIFVAGDSAGGNLAAAVALMSRDHQGPDIAGQILIYPDVSPLYHPYEKEIIAANVPPSAEFINAVGQAYAGGSTKGTPYHSPLLVKDLSDLPPAIVVTAGFDLLSTEGIMYSVKLSNAGVPVTKIHMTELGHGFISMVGLLDEADSVIEQIGGFVSDTVLAN